MTAMLDLAASRNVAWTPTIDLFYDGDPLPLTGANIELQVRLYPGAPGAPIAAIPDVYFEDNLIDIGKRCLRLGPGIERSALAAFPTGINKPEPGEADAFAYDIIITYADGFQDKAALGKFILEPGVTLP